MKERGSLEDNTELYPKEMWWVSMNWINVAQGKDKRGGFLVNMIMNHRFSQNVGISRLATDYTY